jgi:FtsP/CotA-like multicopper oxidase with cupredoxin domain
MSVSRRSFLKAAGLVAGSALVAPAVGQVSASPDQGNDTLPDTGKVDYTIRIAATPVEIAPNKIISLTTYNGQFPGPLLRFKEGQKVVVNLVNDTNTPE